MWLEPPRLSEEPGRTFHRPGRGILSLAFDVLVRLLSFCCVIKMVAGLEVKRSAQHTAPFHPHHSHTCSPFHPHHSHTCPSTLLRNFRRLEPVLAGLFQRGFRVHFAEAHSQQSQRYAFQGSGFKVFLSYASNPYIPPTPAQEQAQTTVDSYIVHTSCVLNERKKGVVD